MRRGLVLGFVSVSALLVAAVACGSSSDNGSSGGAPDGSTGDDASSGGPGDGSSGGPGDGSSGGPDAPAGPFCASLSPKPKLCEDFDDNTPPQNSVTDTGAGASQGIDTSIGLSPPNSYKTQVPTIASQIAYALLETPLDATAATTRFVVAFDFRPDAAPPATGTLVIVRAFLSQTHAVSIELTSENGPVIREQEGNPPTLDRPSGKLPSLPAAGSWTRYELTIDLTAKTATLKAAGAAAATLTLTGVTANDYFAVNLGLQSDAAFTARYDNFVIDY